MLDPCFKSYLEIIPYHLIVCYWFYLLLSPLGSFSTNHPPNTPLVFCPLIPFFHCYQQVSRHLVLSKMSIRHLVMPKGAWYLVLSKTTWHGPKMLMDILDRKKFQGSFGLNQNVSSTKRLMDRTKCPARLQTYWTLLF